MGSLYSKDRFEIFAKSEVLSGVVVVSFCFSDIARLSPGSQQN